MWTVEFIDDGAELEVRELSEDLQLKFARIVNLIEAFGIAKIHEPYIKHIEGKIWEMRLLGKNGIARSLYVTASGKRVIILRTFIKKTQKTPRNEIEYAQLRIKDIKP